MVVRGGPADAAAASTRVANRERENIFLRAIAKHEGWLDSEINVLAISGKLLNWRELWNENLFANRVMKILSPRLPAFAARFRASRKRTARPQLAL